MQTKNAKRLKALAMREREIEQLRIFLQNNRNSRIQNKFEQKEVEAGNLRRKLGTERNLK